MADSAQPAPGKATSKWPAAEPIIVRPPRRAALNDADRRQAVTALTATMADWTRQEI
jgi:hypothetical protein